MAEDSLNYPPVFKDTISSSEAPAKIGSSTPYQAERKQAVVIDQIQARGALKEFADSQPSPEDIKPTLNEALAKAERAQANLEFQQSRKASEPTGLNQFNFIRSITGSQTPAEKEEVVAQAQSELQTASSRVEGVRADQKGAEMYTPDYLKKQSDPQRIQELVEANQRGGPMGVSEKMTQALDWQKLIQDEIKFFKNERAYGELPNPDQLLPPEVFARVKSKEGQDFYHQGEELVDVLKIYQAINEAAIEYSSQRGLKLDRAILIEAYNRGSEFKTENDPKQSVEKAMARRYWIARKLYGENSHLNQSYLPNLGIYAFTAAELDDFFQGKEIPNGKSRIPYVLAYVAGQMETGALYNFYEKPLGLVRDLIADCIPIENTRVVLKDGKWQEEKFQEPKGFGSFIDHSNPFSVWEDISARNQMTYEQQRVLYEANKIAGTILDKFYTNRVSPDKISYRMGDDKIRNPDRYKVKIIK